MSGKKAMDLGIVLSCAAGILLSVAYLNPPAVAAVVTGGLFITAICFLVDAFRTNNGNRQNDRGNISEIILLSEEGTEVSVWDIWGKSSVIFGLSDRRNKVDVDLTGTAYAGMLNREHAVMNFYNGDWFIEDLGSENGVYIQKEDGIKNKLSKAPCKVDKNDMIYLGITKLKVR